MNRLPGEILDLLAAEYALGTQTRRVRARLEKMSARDPELAARIEWWQEKLAGLAQAAPPVPVPLRVWRRLEQELGHAEGPHSPSRGWWNSLPVWRWSTALAALLLVLSLLLTPAPQPPAPSLTAEGGVVLVLTDEESHTAWLVSRKSAEEPLKAQPLTLPVLSLQQAYELWLLPPDEAPRSLGLLSDSDSTELRLPGDLAARLEPGYGMAVSIEPAGGSPTGAPTGPVVYTGSIREL